MRIFFKNFTTLFLSISRRVFKEGKMDGYQNLPVPSWQGTYSTADEASLEVGNLTYTCLFCKHEFNQKESSNHFQKCDIKFWKICSQDVVISENYFFDPFFGILFFFTGKKNNILQHIVHPTIHIYWENVSNSYREKKFEILPEYKRNRIILKFSKGEFLKNSREYFSEERGIDDIFINLRTSGRVNQKFPGRKKKRKNISSDLIDDVIDKKKKIHNNDTDIGDDMKIFQSDSTNDLPIFQEDLLYENFAKMYEMRSDSVDNEYLNLCLPSLSPPEYDMLQLLYRDIILSNLYSVKNGLFIKSKIEVVKKIKEKILQESNILSSYFLEINQLQEAILEILTIILIEKEVYLEPINSGDHFKYKKIQLTNHIFTGILSECLDGLSKSIHMNNYLPLEGSPFRNYVESKLTSKKLFCGHIPIQMNNYLWPFTQENISKMNHKYFIFLALFVNNLQVRGKYLQSDLVDLFLLFLSNFEKTITLPIYLPNIQVFCPQIVDPKSRIDFYY